jgi:small conductance mechanosensitive channel
VSELADSSVNFVVRLWVESADYWDVFFDANETVKIRFDEAGIGIPFPQRDVHVYEHQAA